MDPQCFCCTTLRDVIFTEQCSVDVMSMTIVYYTCSGMLGHRIKQLDNEHVAQAWERMKYLVKNCPTHGLMLG